MKLVTIWLDSVLSRLGADAPSNSGSTTPDELELPGDLANLVNEASMPYIYADTLPDLKILAPSLSDADKETGFNPYDTLRMHKK